MAKKQQVITLEDFSVTKLSEFQGKKEQQEQLVKDNPFVEIIDNESYQDAKKNRTALVTGRTTLDKERKEVARKIKNIITDPVSKAYEELIGISKPHEDKQQEEVKRYEAEKEKEKKEKEIAEQRRIDEILKKIEVIVFQIKNEINNLTYRQSISYTINPKFNNKEVSESDFEEYASKYVSEIESLEFELSQKKEALQVEENNRIKAEELEKEAQEQRRIKSIQQNIYEFQKYWNMRIARLTDNEANSILNEFENSKDFDCQEFKKDYEDVKEQVFEALKSKVNQIHLHIEAEKQRKEAEVLKRKAHLASLGFDYNTLVFVKDSFSFKFDEDYLHVIENQFISYVNEFKRRLYVFEHPPKKQTGTQKETKQIENTQPEEKLTKNQLRSIDFLTRFATYNSENSNNSTEVNIKDFVLKNVK